MYTGADQEDGPCQEDLLKGIATFRIAEFCAAFSPALYMAAILTIFKAKGSYQPLNNRC
jgi:hypothetical protein